MSRARAYIAVALGIVCAASYGVVAGAIAAGLFLALSAAADA